MINLKRLSIRHAVQLVFAVVVLYIGLTFMVFVGQLVNGLPTSVARPAGVEAFLPISALVGLKAWLGTGQFDPVHPAGLVIFLAAIILSLVLKRTFCSWICPIGTLSEGLAGIGRRLLGKNYKVPKWLDYPLRSLKYILLAFFVFFVFMGMSGPAAAAFLNTPYNMVSDVMMLRFFQDLSLIGLSVLGLLVILSMLFENFWCRYFCPYGGLLGLLSMLSPFKITRNKQQCIQCGQCTANCPNRLQVDQADRISSPECTGCLNCVNHCPVKDTLTFQISKGKRHLSPRYLALGVVAVWVIIIVSGMVSGHWESRLTPEMYRELLPLVM